VNEATHDLLEVDMHEDLLSVSEAATHAGVDAARIRQWKRRGHLQPAGLDAFGRPMFRLIDVLRAWTAAEQRHARTQAHLVATRRESPTA
jgi:hypothetical protein